MKQLIAITALTSLGALAHANTINAPSSLIGYETLQGNDAYAWNVDPNLSAGQDIASATISFTGITLNVPGSTGHGNLYTDILNSQMTGSHGLTTAVDNDQAGDYWATKYSGNNIMSLGDEYFQSRGTTLSWSYTLTGDQLTELNSYLANGSFNIAIDPDCHFSAECIQFDYTVGTPNIQGVPDVAVTGLLLGGSLLGLELVRRKYAFAK
jgi:hypothetical protein